MAKAKLKTLLSKVIQSPPPDPALALMREAYDLKLRLDPKVDDDHYDPEIHLARRYDEVRGELAQIQSIRGVEEIRLDGLKFAARCQPGRKTLDQALLRQNMLAEGLPANVVEHVINTSTKEGDPYWVKTISMEKR